MLARIFRFGGFANFVRPCWLIATMLLVFFMEVAAQGLVEEMTELKVRIDTKDEDGVFYKGEHPHCFIQINNESDHARDLQVTWEISTDDWQPLMARTLPLKLDNKQSTLLFCPWYDFPGPGFYRYFATVMENGDELLQVSMVIGIDPEALKPSMDPPEDLMQFWDSSIAALRSVKPEPNLMPIKKSRNSKTELFEVELKSYGNLTVRGWLEVPKRKGKFPVLLRVPGYTEDLQPVGRYDDMIVFSFNTRDHGNSDDTGERSYDMWVRGMESKENYYYRGIFLDCIRAIDYLESRDDTDMEKLAIWGGSQGGGLSFAMAALDRRVKLCVADIPYMCDYPRYFAITHWDEVDHWFAQDPTHTWELMFETLSYFDTKYMAKMITCPVMMGIGLQDDVCPPSTSFMTYNLIESEKSYDIYKTEKHAQPDVHYEQRYHAIRQYFGLE